MNIEHLPIAALIPYARNARTHSDAQVSQIAGSIREFGFTNPVLIGADNDIIAGHGRVMAARVLKLDTVPCIRLGHLNELQRRAYVLADNRIALNSGWDEAMLALELTELLVDGLNLESLGFATDELDRLLNPPDNLPSGAPVAVEDEVPEIQDVAVASSGELWTLGVHRLLCGDSTKSEDVNRLMGGEKAALILADPPYFAKVDADWDNDFDGFPGFLDFLRSVFALWSPVMLDRGTAGWWCAPDFAWHIEGLLREHFAVFNHLVWYKGESLGAMTSVEAMRRWRPRSERLLLCEKLHSPDALLASFNQKTAHIAARAAYSNIIDRMMAWREASGLTNAEIDQHLGTNGMAGHYFGRSQWSLPNAESWAKLHPLFLSRGVDIGDFDAQRREFDAQRREFDAVNGANFTDVWQMLAPAGNERPDHPTPKPIPFISKLVSAHSRNGDLVCDPFLGSGTTLIAAEQLGRTCFGMEISPVYCDLIIRRWQALTGKSAVREDGVTFDQLEAAIEAERITP